MSNQVPDWDFFPVSEDGVFRPSSLHPFDISIPLNSSVSDTDSYSEIFRDLSDVVLCPSSSASLAFPDELLLKPNFSDDNIDSSGTIKKSADMVRGGYQTQEIEGLCGDSERRKQSGLRKRSRPAEQHNLSEKKRRDRIKGKMKALRELIPNCNKSDKVSVLVEAIEHLKTLQLQVQMLSMGGGGLCQASYMSPTALQIPYLYQFPASLLMRQRMGMGMGMGFGMDMIPNLPLIAIPSVSPHWSLSTALGFHQLPGSGMSLVSSIPMPMKHMPVAPSQYFPETAATSVMPKNPRECISVGTSSNQGEGSSQEIHRNAADFQPVQVTLNCIPPFLSGNLMSSIQLVDEDAGIGASNLGQGLVIAPPKETSVNGTSSRQHRGRRTSHKSKKKQLTRQCFMLMLFVTHLVSLMFNSSCKPCLFSLIKTR